MTRNDEFIDFNTTSPAGTLFRKVNGFGKRYYEISDCQYIIKQLTKIMQKYESAFFNPAVTAMQIENISKSSVNLVTLQHYIEMYRIYRNLIQMLDCDANNIPRKLDVMTNLCYFAKATDVFEESFIFDCRKV